jgi:hypothetical protein
MSKKSAVTPVLTRPRLSVEESLQRAFDAIVLINAAALTDVEQLEGGAITLDDLLGVIGSSAQDIAEELYWLKKLPTEVLNAARPSLGDEGGA